MGQVQVIVLAVFLFLFIASASAIDTYAANEEINLKHPVRLNGGIISGALCNITIFYPNSSIMVDYQPMTDNGDHFNYTINLSQSNIKGIYTYDVTCSGGGYNNTASFDFLINSGGVEPSDSRTAAQTRNILLFVGLAFICFIALLFVKSIPIKMTMFLLMVWFLLMGINFIYIGIGDEVLNPAVENFFSFFLTLSFYANYFIFISIAILWLFTIIINLKNLGKRRKASKYGLESM